MSDVVTPSSSPPPAVMSMADRLAPAISGPWVRAVCGQVEAVLDNTFGVLGSEFVAAMDTRDPVWQPDRPEWHLTLLEREAQIPVGGQYLGMTLDDRYRAVRMADVSRWSEGGKWADLLRLAAAWLRMDVADPSLLRVYAWPVVVVYLMHPNVVPQDDNRFILRQELIGTIMDVAGWGVVSGLPGLVLSFDLPGQGFDAGLWGTTVDSSEGG